MLHHAHAHASTGAGVLGAAKHTQPTQPATQPRSDELERLLLAGEGEGKGEAGGAVHPGAGAGMDEQGYSLSLRKQVAYTVYFYFYVLALDATITNWLLLSPQCPHRNAAARARSKDARVPLACRSVVFRWKR